jgi:flagellar hook-associated protein 3 FlgL
MTISTKMFNEQTIANLGRLSDQLNGLQEQVASGKKPIKPSIDPIEMSKLSAAKDLQAGLSRYRGNMTRIENRLSETDVALGQVQNVMIRIKELAIQATNDTLNAQDRLSIQKEVAEHKRFLVGLGNSRDAQGQALFGGYMTNSDPFEIGLDGSVSYSGDDGMHSLPVSASLSISTGIDGASSFMRIQTAQGPKSVFDIVREFETALETSAHYQTDVNVTSAEGALLSFDIGRQPEPQSLRIEGATGSADITVTMVSGAMQPMIEAINAESANTGVVAEASEDGNGIVLSDLSKRPFRIAQFETGAVRGAQSKPDNQILVQEIVSGEAVGSSVVLVDKDGALDVSLSGLDAVISHMALTQAQVGAFSATAELRSDMLAQQELMVEETLSGIEDADLSAVVTQLQSLLVNRDALRQVFANVGQQSLFDLIR